ncbi:MAG: STAS domain-containing protein [Rhodospirillaceae bacterium]
MDVVKEELGGVTRVTPKGRIDSTTAKRFLDELNGVILEGCRRLVIDFHEVQFISSAGFRSLLVADANLRQASGMLALCRLPAEVQRLFEIGAFTEHFTIYASAEECLQKLSPDSGRSG